MQSCKSSTKVRKKYTYIYCAGEASSTVNLQSDALVKISIKGKDSIQTLDDIAASMKPEGVLFVHDDVKKCK